MNATQHNQMAVPKPVGSTLYRLLETHAYAFFKYAIYLALLGNVFFFFREEFAASRHLFAEGVPLGLLIESFAASIDTAAWVVLLLMFELETHQIPDERLTPRVTAMLLACRILCYAVIVYAFTGYLGKALAFGAAPAPFADACTVVDGTRSLMVDLDEFVTLGLINCAAISEPYLFNQAEVVVDRSVYVDSWRLAWLDVINSGAWLLVVGLFELEVWLQLRGRLGRLAYRAFNWAKVVLYVVLFGAAIYWGFKGDFLDFWDASLWLLAFFIIELNVFQWREETRQGA